MSIITSNRPKKQTLVDPIFVLFFSVLLVLLVLAMAAANGSSFVERILQTNDSAPAGLTLNSEVSFASDQLYWSEHCDSGWSSDSACDAIVARAQACSASVNSAYCSAYESYLLELSK
jgi:hypothetical protein